jgi:hypothetical protein
VEAKPPLCVPGVAILISLGHLKSRAEANKLIPRIVKMQNESIIALINIFFIMNNSPFIILGETYVCRKSAASREPVTGFFTCPLLSRLSQLRNWFYTGR